jgi:hypothetical protein
LNQFSHPIYARIITLAAIATIIGLDILLVALGYSSVSSQVTTLNERSGWLICIGWCGLAVHFFVVPYLVKR